MGFAQKAGLATIASLLCTAQIMPETRSLAQELPAAEDGHVEELTPHTFGEFVLNSNLPVVVDFSTAWCVPCRQLKPIYEQVCVDLRGQVRCASYDAHQDDYAVSRSYGINDGFPTVIPFCRGVPGEELHLISLETFRMDETVLMQGMKELVDSCQ
ncbi:MAG TPA: hypothetical protein HA362_07345 [Nanoarchaeota archaeon]|nr:hypothetical protein [Nanoarchaeota archaeon]